MGQSRKYWICPALVPNSQSADIIVCHYVLCTKGVWHKPNLSILPRVCPYISRFSGRGRWILCVVVDVAEIVGVAMPKMGVAPKFRICPASILIRLATMQVYDIYDRSSVALAL